jgi:hypothetical protein
MWESVTCWGWNRLEVVVVGGWRTRAVVPSTYDRRRRREEALEDEVRR